jgi:hypothetical protein
MSTNPKSNPSPSQADVKATTQVRNQFAAMEIAARDLAKDLGMRAQGEARPTGM